MTGECGVHAFTLRRVQFSNLIVVMVIIVFCFLYQLQTRTFDQKNGDCSIILNNLSCHAR